MTSGESPLSRPTKDSQRSAQGTRGAVVRVVGPQWFPGSRPQGSGHVFPSWTRSKWTPYRVVPKGLSPPFLTGLRRLSARGGHQAPSSKQKASPMLTGASSRRSGPHPILRAAPPSRPAPSPASFEAAAQVRADVRKSVQGRPSGPRPHPGRPARDGRFSAAPPLGELSGSVRQRLARRPAGPRPPHRPDQPGTLRGPLRGGKTAPPRSPLPRHPPLTAPHTGAPASTPPGTDAESAPPEPILQACAMLGSVATPPSCGLLIIFVVYNIFTYA
ncbi:hypothetical protein NDU88_001311 [Pleurodeles waltl]|uniref:Basic proline-rich protein-like n=1 Tax=Pleurodeles waltl TaxID=8319 RepID=A0AAV7Q3Y7_PLEWA|nr:hypothetical protein NDU88_001311 [Pleurodeles waltl]